MGKVTDIKEKRDAKAKEAEKPSTPNQDKFPPEVPDLPPEMQEALRHMPRADLMQFFVVKTATATHDLLNLLGQAVSRCKDCYTNPDTHCAACTIVAGVVHQIGEDFAKMTKCMIAINAPASVVGKPQGIISPNGNDPDPK